MGEGFAMIDSGRCRLLVLLALLCFCVPVWSAPAVRKVSTIKFSGYTWQVIQSPAPRGPGPNIFNSNNVKLDGQGRLVLETCLVDGLWTSAHVFLTKSLGYGRYELVLAPMENPLDDLTVFGFFTWDDNPAYANREIDMEIARWALPQAPNLNFTVQPSADRPDRSGLAEFDFSSRTTLVFVWEPGLVRFSVESDTGSFSWRYPSAGEPGPVPFGAPPKGNERVGLNLWLFQGRTPASADRVIMERFRFSPHPKP